MIKMIKE